MTSIVKPETQSKSAAIRAQFPPDIQAKIEENRARNVMVAQIRGTQWAKDCSDQVIRAVAEYAHRYGIDPVTEMEILGGRIYKSAAYYERRGAELIQAGIASAIVTDHVESDARLEEQYKRAMQYAEDAVALGDAPEADRLRETARSARREILRRQDERIRWNAPEKSAAVVVTRIYLSGVAQPIEGCNWCGNGVRPRDPVGDAEPSKTAETRSARRAWKKLVTSEIAQKDARLTGVVRAEGRIGEEGAALSEIITDERAQIAADHAAERPHLLAGTNGNDYYAPNADAPSEGQGELIPAEPPKRRTSMTPNESEG